MLYHVLKFLHVTGAVVLVGNVTITAFWKVMADRSGDPKLIEHAQRNVIIADWIFTLAGIALIFIGGYGMAFMAGLNVLEWNWLGYSQVLFFLSGIIWLAVLIPCQVRMARLSRQLQPDGSIPFEFKRTSRIWLFWGIWATVPLIAALYFMIVKYG